MNLTANVDVICLTLMLFMLMAAVNLQKSIAVEVRLDNELNSCLHDDLCPTVEIDAYDQILVDDLPVEGPMELRAALAKLHRTADTSRLRLLLDPDSTHRRRIQVADAAAIAGFRRIDCQISEVY